jgi:hypothetical protein
MTRIRRLWTQLAEAIRKLLGAQQKKPPKKPLTGTPTDDPATGEVGISIVDELARRDKRRQW